MKAKLRTLSPLHIGGKEQGLLPLEYVVVEGNCYVLSEEKLSWELVGRRLLEPFLEWIRSQERPEIKEFLQRRSLCTSQFLKACALHHSRCLSPVRRDPRPFIRNGYGEPFLPGTALKGVLRTAILYKILKGLSPEQRRKVLDDFVSGRLQEYRSDPRAQKGFRWFQERFKQWFAQRLDQEVFQKFTLSNNQRGFDPHTDILRCLRVSDSPPVPPDSAIMEEIKIASARSTEGLKRWSIYAECLPAGMEFEVEIQVDAFVLNNFAKKNSTTRLGMDFRELEQILSNPLAAAAEMASDLLREDRAFFARKLGLDGLLAFREGTPNLRMGWGGGLLGASMGMLLPEGLRQDLRNTLFTDRGNAPAPKSRRVVMRQGQPWATLGWIQVLVEGVA
ncbi:MAG: type III-A CRISPR-associated RAMP protein Csm5 [Chloroflexi bacterium]|nr:type III-A CRISPR-associated RAMP protein Csm5 [Chloroflexota bacterium]